MLVVIGANVYAGNKTKLRALNVIRKSGADSVGINEGRSFVNLLGRLSGYRVIHDKGGKDKRGANDTPIATKKSLPSLGMMALRVSEAAKPVRIAPDRWFHVSMFDHEIGHVAHINVHPNAAVNGHPASVGRVREYDESMRSLDRIIDFLAREGFLIVVTGDLNFPKDGKSPDWLDPVEVFRRNNLEFFIEGIDGMAWSRELRLHSVRKIDKEKTGSDHIWLVGTFKRS